MMFLHSIGALTKSTTVGLCFHLAALSSFLSPLLADNSRIPERPDAHLFALAVHRIREADGRRSTFACGPVIRLVRNSMLEVMNLEFVTALRAKGTGETRIWLRHILRNALVPAVTLLGVQLGALLSGAVVAETVFGRQGLGSLLVTGIQDKDYPMVQAIVLIIATAYVVINIGVDVGYAFLDPRVRTQLAR